MRRRLVSGSVISRRVGFVKDEARRVVGRLQDVEAPVAGFADRGFVIGVRGGDEGVDGFRLDADVDERDVHGGDLPCVVA